MRGAARVLRNRDETRVSVEIKAQRAGDVDVAEAVRRGIDTVAGNVPWQGAFASSIAWIGQSARCSVLVNKAARAMKEEVK